MRPVSESLENFYKIEVTPNSVEVMYLGYSGILLRTVKHVLAFDVDELISKKDVKNIKKLDVLLFTHGHYDHFEKKVTVELYKKTEAKVVCEEAVYNKLKKSIPETHLIKVTPGSVINVNEVSVEAIKGRHVGPIILYLIEVDGIKIFHGGDSDYVPLYPRRANIAIVPTGTPSPTASPDAAYRMVVDLRPNIAIPVHGKESQHMEFEEKVKKYYPETKVVILELLKPTFISLGEGE
mgnify:CR=1 FL=1